MKRLRNAILRWIKTLLEETEDDLSYIQPSDPTTRPTLREIRDNHIAHLTVASNQLHIRVGRLEAKMGLLLGMATALIVLVIGEFLDKNLVRIMEVF